MTQSANESNPSINTEPPNYSQTVNRPTFQQTNGNQVPVFLPPQQQNAGPVMMQYTLRPVDFQAVQQHNLMYKRFLQERHMKETFPLGYVVFHSLFMLLLCLAIITIQVFLLVEDAYGSYAGGGFWSGVWLLFTSIFTLSSIGCKNMCTTVTSVVFHLMSIFFVFSGCVIMPIVTVTSSQACNYEFYPESCDTVTIWQLSYSLLSLGCLVIILCLIFSVLILVKVVNKNREFSRQVSYSQQFGTPNPVFTAHNNQVQFSQTC